MSVDMNSTYTYQTFELVTLSTFPFQDSYLIPGIIDSMNEALIIGALSQVENYMEQKNLSVISGLSRPSITVIMGGMIEKGLIEQIENPQDKRGYLIALTKLGKKVASWMIARKQAINKIQLKGISEKEIETFNSIATRMAQNILNVSDKELMDLPTYDEYQPSEEEAPSLITKTNRALFLSLSNRLRLPTKKTK